MDKGDFNIQKEKEQINQFQYMDEDPLEINRPTRSRSGNFDNKRSNALTLNILATKLNELKTNNIQKNKDNLDKEDEFLNSPKIDLSSENNLNQKHEGFSKK